MSYSDEQNDSDDFDAHIDHDEPVDGCDSCELELEALRAEAGQQNIDALLEIFTAGLDPAKREFIEQRWALPRRAL